MTSINLANMFLNMQCSSANSSLSNSANSNANVATVQSSNNFSSQLSKAQSSQTTNNSKKSTKTNEVQQASSSQKKNTNASTKDKVDESTSSKTSETKDTSTKKSDSAEKTNQTEQTKVAQDTMSSEDEEVNEVAKEVNDAIMSLLQQSLQLPAEEIQSVMQEMNIEPIDLLNQNTFMEFVSALYPEMDESSMLLEENPLQDIGKLFTQIEELASDFEDNLGIDVMQLIADRNLQKSETGQQFFDQQTAQTKMPNVVNEAIENYAETPLSENMQTVQVQAVSTEEPVNASAAPHATVAASVAGLSSEVPDIGMVLPVNEATNIQDLSLQLQSKTQTVTSPHQNVELTDQIINKIDFKALGDMKEVNMQLTPKELGNLSIRLVETSGSIVAEIKVESEKTKAFLLNEVDSLKDALAEQGLNVSDVKVDIKQNESQAQMQQQQQKSSKRIQELINQAFDELEEEEAPLAVENDTEVDYMV